MKKCNFSPKISPHLPYIPNLFHVLKQKKSFATCVKTQKKTQKLAKSKKCKKNAKKKTQLAFFFLKEIGAEGAEEIF